MLVTAAVIDQKRVLDKSCFLLIVFSVALEEIEDAGSPFLECQMIVGQQPFQSDHQRLQSFAKVGMFQSQPLDLVRELWALFNSAFHVAIMLLDGKHSVEMFAVGACGKPDTRQFTTERLAGCFPAQ